MVLRVLCKTKGIRIREIFKISFRNCVPEQEAGRIHKMVKENSTESEPAISLRMSTEADFDFVFNLNKINMRKYVEKIRGWNEEYERTDMKTKFTQGIDQIIQVDGQDAGVLRVIETDTEIKLDHIELLPEFQGKGIGRKIIGVLLTKGKRVSLQVLKQNPAAELYKSVGFKVVGETDLKYLMSTELPDSSQ